MVEQDDLVTYKLVPLHASALPHALPFPPPYAHLSTAPEGFVYWWRLIQFVYDLPSPQSFPPLPGFEDAEERVLRRYVDVCEELSRSTVLSTDRGDRIAFTHGEPEPQIVHGGPPAEALRGTTVLFRQLASNDERASFVKVRNIIGRRVHETPDTQRGEREELHAAWKRAHAGLQQGLLRTAADVKVAEAINWDQPVGGEDVRPQHILSLFQYGDLIHWGRHATDFETLASDGFDYSMARSHFIDVLLQLSHFYLGYAVLVRSAMAFPDLLSEDV